MRSQYHLVIHVLMITLHCFILYERSRSLFIKPSGECHVCCYFPGLVVFHLYYNSIFKWSCRPSDHEMMVLRKFTKISRLSSRRWTSLLRNVRCRINKQLRTWFHNICFLSKVKTHFWQDLCSYLFPYKTISQ